MKNTQKNSELVIELCTVTFVNINLISLQSTGMIPGLNVMSFCRCVWRWTTG